MTDQERNDQDDLNGLTVGRDCLPASTKDESRCTCQFNGMPDWNCPIHGKVQTQFPSAEAMKAAHAIRTLIILDQLGGRVFPEQLATIIDNAFAGLRQQLAATTEERDKALAQVHLPTSTK